MGLLSYPLSLRVDHGPIIGLTLKLSNFIVVHCQVASCNTSISNSNPFQKMLWPMGKGKNEVKMIETFQGRFGTYLLKTENIVAK